MAAGLFDGEVQVIGEEDTIGQARQRIRERVLPQTFISLFAFGDVARDALHTDRATILKDEARADLQGHAATVLRYDLKLIDCGLARRLLAPDHVAGHLQMFRRDHLRDVHLDRLVARVAGDALARLVQTRKSASEVVRIDDVIGVLE